LLATLNAIRTKDQEDKRFYAALQGVDLEQSPEYREEEDITSIKGFRAAQEGFGIGEGLGHIVEDIVE